MSLYRYHPQRRTTKYIERLHLEIRRWERIINIYLNPQPAFRLIGAAPKDYDTSL
ncbi:hypothetical protein JCM19039_2937 [Geomicrobium sp. JCM 19039]|nr:hypothetical protein JCM19039_2937 [Geomicrobium sp. JCM 19039]